MNRILKEHKKEIKDVEISAKVIQGTLNKVCIRKCWDYLNYVIGCLFFHLSVGVFYCYCLLLWWTYCILEKKIIQLTFQVRTCSFVPVRQKMKWGGDARCSSSAMSRATWMQTTTTSFISVLNAVKPPELITDAEKKIQMTKCGVALVGVR